MKTCTVDLEEQYRWHHGHCRLHRGLRSSDRDCSFSTAQRVTRGQRCVDDSPGGSEFEFHFAQNAQQMAVRTVVGHVILAESSLTLSMRQACGLPSLECCSLNACWIPVIPVAVVDMRLVFLQGPLRLRSPTLQSRTTRSLRGGQHRDRGSHWFENRREPGCCVRRNSTMRWKPQGDIFCQG